MGLRRHYHEPSTPNFDKFELGLIGMHISLTHQRKSVEVLMLQLRASGVGVMLHLSLKSVIGQRRRVARSNTTQSVAGSTRHNRWVGAILADMNKSSNTTHISLSNFGDRSSSIIIFYIALCRNNCIPGTLRSISPRIFLITNLESTQMITRPGLTCKQVKAEK